MMSEVGVEGLKGDRECGEVTILVAFVTETALPLGSDYNVQKPFFGLSPGNSVTDFVGL